jgi:hypothetical protein
MTTEKDVNDPLIRNIEESLNERMDELGKEIGKPLAFRRPPAEGSQANQLMDVQKLMEIGGRMLKQKMDEHMSAVSAYELQRTELIDSYRVRMERLKIEADEQLYSLEQTHRAKLESMEKLINKLRTLREE